MFWRRDRSLDPSAGDGNHKLARNEKGWHRRWRKLLSRLYDTVTLPAAAWHIFDRDYIHDDHGISGWDLVKLSVRMWANVQKVWTGTHLRAHMMMAQAIFEIPPKAKGVVVECGCFLGGTTANLSLACEMAGRRLVVYDSFEGLPPAVAGDRYAADHLTGYLRSDLDRVRDHVAANGAPAVVEFRKGFFSDTLPGHREQIVMAFFDVDYQSSLHDCMIHLWPKVRRGSKVFLDEFVLLDYCALFWSESWWRTYQPDEDPPGLVGAGTGVPLGGHYVGPLTKHTSKQMPHSLAYTVKGTRAVWTFEPSRGSGSAAG